MLIDEIEEVLGPYFPYTFTTDLRFVLALSFVVAALATRTVMPVLIRKLRGADIVGIDVNKEDRPEIPEMGGLGWLLGLYTGVFAALLVLTNGAEQTFLYLAGLLTVTGAAMAGILDDLVGLRQRFKAAISFIFAAPLVVFLADYVVHVPLLGIVDFGLLYPLVLVPLAVASAAQSMNMLEGFNGLAAGNSLIIALGLTALAVLRGNHAALPLLVPFVGATLVFAWYNVYPARVFPGDVFTLASGALLAVAAVVGDMEVAALVMFTPQIAEFFLKVRSRFDADTFATAVDAGKVHYHGPIDSLTHALMTASPDGLREPALVKGIWGLQVIFAAAAVLAGLGSIHLALVVTAGLVVWLVVRGRKAERVWGEEVAEG